MGLIRVHARLRPSWVLVAGLMVGGCPSGRATEDRCRLLCGQLASCALLPSALGAPSGEGADEAVTGKENCVERCVATPDEAREPILRCDDDLGTSTPTWCDGTSRCSDLSACLLGTFPGVPVTGVASVRVEAWANTCDDVQEATGSLRGCAGGPLVGACPWSAHAKEACTPDVTVRAFVTQGEAKRFGAARQCLEALSRHSVFAGITPGRLTAGIRVTFDGGSSSSGAGGEAGAPQVPLGQQCRDFSAEVIVRAGQVSALIPVLVPAFDAGVACEVCDDNGDNDDNGLADCDDPKCLLECEQQAAQDAAKSAVQDGGILPLSEER